MAEREEDRVHLARFSRLAEETRGNLNAVERILRTFDERLVSTDAAAAQSRREFGETTDSLAKRSEQAAGRLAQDLAQASSGLADLQHRLKERTRLTDEAVAAANSKTAALAARLNEVHRGEPYFESSDGPARFDDFYFAFERRYRGTREEIARRQQVYLPFLSESLPVTRSSKDQAPVLDLGCGRGEWLGLLRQEGYAAAAGIDQSERMIEICHSEGLPVTRGEALQHLRSLPDASVAAVSAFHVVEHIPFSVLLELLSETRRVLMPGGLLLLETPNAENALVATVNFRHDPTHRHMIPPLLLSFAVEHAGFGEPTPLRLHPYGPEYLVESSSSVARRFNDFFFGAQDFGLVAVKP
jgi:SAM-dependent methyltransferase